MSLSYPSPERKQRQLLGGIAYIALGAVLGIAGWGFGEGFISLFGALAALLGITVLGVRRETHIDPEQQLLQHRSGWYFLQRCRELSFDAIVEVRITRRAYASQRFSKFDDQNYEHTVNVSYTVSLHGEDLPEMVVEQTSNQTDAQQWAGDIANCLNTSVVTLDEPPPPSAALRHKIMRGVKISLGLLMAGAILVLFMNVLF